ncbi:MAG: very short patch repair endonuclease [Syntrophobacteraceae bacterium]
MSRITGSNTRPEIVVRKLLHGMGYRFRLHVKSLPGKPDIVLPRHKKIILVHGCFWHGHVGCNRSKPPSSNVEFWQKKLLGNRERDEKTLATLTALGWKVLVVWSCETRKLELLKQKMKGFLENGAPIKTKYS